MELPLLLETEELITSSALEAEQSVKALLKTEIGVFCQSVELGNIAPIHTALFEEMDYSVRRALSRLRGVVVTRVSRIDEETWGISYLYNGEPNSITI